MKNPATRSAPRAGFSVSDNGSNKTRNLSEATASPQAGSTSSDQLDGNGVHIAVFWKSPRNRREAIQVSLKQYQGHPYLDARVYASDVGGRMVPTQRGIAVGVKTLPQFAKAIGDGYRKAVQLGLITAGSS
jgi:hypothetical protein